MRTPEIIIENLPMWAVIVIISIMGIMLILNFVIPFNSYKAVLKAKTLNDTTQSILITCKELNKQTHDNIEEAKELIGKSDMIYTALEGVIAKNILPEMDKINKKYDNLVDMIEPISKELETRTAFIKTINNSIQRFLLFHKDNPVLCKIMEGFKVGIIEWHDRVLQIGLYDITDEELEYIYNDCTNRVKVYYPELEEPMKSVLISKARDNGRMYLENIKSMLKSGIDGRERAFKNTTLAFVDSQIYLISSIHEEFKNNNYGQ